MIAEWVHAGAGVGKAVLCSEYVYNERGRKQKGPLVGG